MGSPQGPLTAEPTVKMEFEAEQTLADMATSAACSHEVGNGDEQHQFGGVAPYEREQFDNIEQNSAAPRCVGLDEFDTFLVGEIIEAQDTAKTGWYSAKVLDMTEGGVKVHYMGWKARFDEVIPLDIGR